MTTPTADHAPAAPAESHAPAHETSHHGETTHASNSWLEKATNKMSRWAGHGVRLLGNELAINWGTGLMTFAVLGTVLTGGATTPLLVAGGLGGALATGGAVAEWDAMKNSNSTTEKSAFVLSKVSQTIGTAALATFGTLVNPAYLPYTWGTYVAGVAMGARSMAHRK